MNQSISRRISGQFCTVNLSFGLIVNKESAKPQMVDKGNKKRVYNCETSMILAANMSIRRPGWA